jgi:hypothetical protein
LIKFVDDKLVPTIHSENNKVIKHNMKHLKCCSTLKMPPIVCNASFSTTCSRKPNSIQNASVFTNLVSGVLNSQTEKILGDLQDAEYLFVASFQFREGFLILQLKRDLLISGQDRAYSFRNARNRAKMLHNVYKCCPLGGIL